MLRKLKERYWDYAYRKSIDARLARPENADFAAYVAVEKERVARGAASTGIDEFDARLNAAIDWLLRAQAATGDDGVSQGYFPITAEDIWKASYPETTGYIITTLLRCAGELQRPELVEAALKMADWEIEVQMANGAVQGGVLCPPEEQQAAAFNTGMVVDGLVSAYENSGQQHYLDAARRGAMFLANDLDENGFFRTNGKYVRGKEVKTYTCLCAWAMFRTGLVTDDEFLKDAAVRSVEAAVAQRNEVGWFQNNCLDYSHMPLTHTIGYALQGILEVGVLTGREDFIDAVRTTLRGALTTLHANGLLRARLGSDWQPRAEHVCLTGSAQLSIICFRLAEAFDDREFLDAGTRLLNFVKATQLLEWRNENMVGAIAGSYPIMGEYMMAGYPNWATKYFIDGLLLYRRLGP